MESFDFYIIKCLINLHCAMTNRIVIGKCKWWNISDNCLEFQTDARDGKDDDLNWILLSDYNGQELVVRSLIRTHFDFQ